MKNALLKPLLAALTLTAVSPVNAADHDYKPSEVQHFWRSPTERAALDKIRSGFTARGGKWIDTEIANSFENRDVAFRRIIQGTPPFAIQWFAGRDLVAMSEAGVLVNLEEAATSRKWSDMLVQKTMQNITVGDGVYGLPVGIHTQNWAWFNRDIINRYGQETPENWPDIIDTLQKVRDDGIDAIAIGQGAWERTHIFSAILISEGGINEYERLLKHGDISVLDMPAFRAALEIYGKLREFDPHDTGVGSWHDATEKLKAGKAAVQFMGDWVLPELKRDGLVAGRDFDCVLSPGRIRKQIAVIDILVFPVDGEDRLTEEHYRMIDTVLSDETQIAYSGAKGAIPVLKSLSGSIEDGCIRKSHQLFNSPQSVPSTVMIVDERIASVVEENITRFWNGEIETAEETIRVIRERVEAHTRVQPSGG
jgi:glucose/mannose transport system substrate-binding protein